MNIPFDSKIMDDKLRLQSWAFDLLFHCIETFRVKCCHGNFVISQVMLQINIQISRHDIDFTRDVDGFTIRGGKQQPYVKTKLTDNTTV